MASPDGHLAPEHGQHLLRDPFASPRQSTMHSPVIAVPAPTLQPHARHDSTAADLYLHEAADAQYYDKATSASMSSEEKSVLTLSQSRESPKRSRNSRNSGHKHNSGAYDLEKGHSPRNSHHSRRSHASRRHMDEEERAQAEERQETHALRILLHLAGPCVALSFLNALWTLVSLVITLCSQPVRICAKRPSFGQQLGGLLGPALNLQLRCIYTPLPPYADEDTTYHPWTLVAVQLLSPVLSLGVMLGAWVVAVFWVSSLVVGDPAGTDRKDDGSESVLMLRKFWEKWLCRSIRYD